MLRRARPPKAVRRTPWRIQADGKRLLIAEADNNAVAVFDVGRARSCWDAIPADWYPTAVAEVMASNCWSSPAKDTAARQPRRSRSADELARGNPRRTTLGQLNGSSARAAQRCHRRNSGGIHASALPPRTTGAERRDATLSAVQARRLHHQGESHLRSGAGRHQGRRRRREPRLFSRRHGNPESSCAGAALRPVRSFFRQCRGAVRKVTSGRRPLT